MAKTGLTLDKLDLLVPEGKTWSICVGAGCSLPIFPTWGELAQAILQSTCGVTKKMACTISQYLSPDIIIQSAYDKSQLEATEFAEHLSSSLYHRILNNLSSLDKKEIIKCLSSTHPDPNRKWAKFIEVVTQHGEPSAMQVARIITEAYVKNKGFFIAPTPDFILDAVLSYENLSGRIQEYPAHINLHNHMVAPVGGVDFDCFVYENEIDAKRVRIIIRDHNERDVYVTSEYFTVV